MATPLLVAWGLTIAAAGIAAVVYTTCSAAQDDAQNDPNKNGVAEKRLEVYPALGSAWDKCYTDANGTLVVDDPYLELVCKKIFTWAAQYMADIVSTSGLPDMLSRNNRVVYIETPSGHRDTFFTTETNAGFWQLHEAPHRYLKLVVGHDRKQSYSVHSLFPNGLVVTVEPGADSSWGKHAVLMGLYAIDGDKTHTVFVERCLIRDIYKPVVNVHPLDSVDRRRRREGHEWNGISSE